MRVNAMHIAGGLGLVLLLTGTASAQQIPWTDRGFINVSGGFQPGSRDANATFTFPLYDETATVTSARKVDGGGFYDVTAGARLFGNIGVGVSVTARSTTADARIDASIPDTIFYDMPRNVSTTLPGLKHQETWVAILAVYALPLTDKIDMMLLVGPAAATVKQDHATGVTVSETPTGPQLTLSTTRGSKTAWGAQGGLDVRYLFTTRMGAGLFLRYARATADLGNDFTVKVGGFQIGAGLRVKF